MPNWRRPLRRSVAPAHFCRPDGGRPPTAFESSIPETLGVGLPRPGSSPRRGETQKGVAHGGARHPTEAGNPTLHPRSRRNRATADGIAPFVTCAERKIAPARIRCVAFPSATVRPPVCAPRADSGSAISFREWLRIDRREGRWGLDSLPLSKRGGTAPGSPVGPPGGLRTRRPARSRVPSCWVARHPSRPARSERPERCRIGDGPCRGIYTAAPAGHRPFACWAQAAGPIARPVI